MITGLKISELTRASGLDFTEEFPLTNNSGTFNTTLQSMFGVIMSLGAGTIPPLMNTTPAVVGSSTKYSRQDHRHPVDTSRAPIIHTHTTSQITDLYNIITDAPKDGKYYVRRNGTWIDLTIALAAQPQGSFN